jgi:hypothetical protein
VVEFAGAGATVPLLGFGYTMAEGVKTAVAEQGLLGAFTGGLTASAGGIAAAVAFFTTGCEAVTPAQIHAAHAVYHLATGSKCVIEHAEK